MLFDLQGSRKTAVKVIYLGLAILMASGLVLFGIGSQTSGGLFDALSNNGGSTKDLQKQVNKSAAAVAANPKSTKALEDLIADRMSLAGSKDNYNTKTQKFNKAGLAQLKLLTKNWVTYDKLATKPNLVTASYAVNAYVQQNDAKGALNAQTVIAEKQPNAANYLQALEFALYAGNSFAATGAEAKARQLATKDQQAQVASEIKRLKKQVAQRNQEFQKQLQQQFAAQQKQGGGQQSNPFAGGGAGSGAGGISVGQ